jgi:pimeloyl-ACP methyl ester carboxylesterase
MRTLGVLVAAGLTAGGLVLAAPAVGSVPGTNAHPAVAGPASPSISWGACPTGQYPDLKGTTVKCAALKVPMNYADPSGPTITLEVSMLPHTSTAAKYKGVILSNPGGPGGASLDLPLYLEPYVPNGVGRDYDWVSWDPRGVGASKPALRCDNSYFKPPRRSYIPKTQSLLHYWLKRSKSYANACERKYPQLLKNMTTIDSAKDMDSIRTALGVAQISYYGYSYGTYLGQVYSTLFPSHLKYMVLDSNVDPRRIWYKANLDQHQDLLPLGCEVRQRLPPGHHREGGRCAVQQGARPPHGPPRWPAGAGRVDGRAAQRRVLPAGLGGSGLLLAGVRRARAPGAPGLAVRRKQHTGQRQRVRGLQRRPVH